MAECSFMNLVVVGWSPIAVTGEICFNFFISNDLTQMVNFATQITDFDSHSPALLDLFVSFDTSICSTMAFPLLKNSDHVFVSVSIDFPSYSQRDVPFHRIGYGYSRADETVFLIICGMFHERISLNSVLLRLLVNFVCGFRLELIDIFLIESIRSSLTHLHGFQLLVQLS